MGKSHDSTIRDVGVRSGLLDARVGWLMRRRWAPPIQGETVAKVGTRLPFGGVRWVNGPAGGGGIGRCGG
jgi:hypothetical protein